LVSKGRGASILTETTALAARSKQRLQAFAAVAVAGEDSVMGA